MKGFLSYKFSGENREDVEALLLPVREVLHRGGHDVYVILYDDELRTEENLKTFGPKEFIHHAFKKLRHAEFVVVLLASPLKSEGMILEMGYAMALGIPVVLAQKEGVTDTYLPSLATVTFGWTDHTDLIAKLADIDFDTLKAPSFA